MVKIRFSNKVKSTLMFLALFVLVVSATMCLSNAQNASTRVFINIISGSEKIILYIPVLLDETGEALKLYEKPAIMGNAKTTVVDTDYGKALKIIGTGTIEVNMSQIDGMLATNSEANERFVNGFTLSTSNATRYGDIHDSVDAWIYSEEDGTVLSFSIDRDNGWGRDMRILTEQPVELTEGWHMVKLSVMSIMYD